MIHLAALPGSPAFGGAMEAVIARALADARALAEAGFPAVMVENYGDAPFFGDRTPAVTVAAMTRVVAEIRAEFTGTVGVNLLRNDGLGAVAVAAATGAHMIRVNVLSGTMFTDQGPLVGRAAEIARERAALAPEVVILADVLVKHAFPPPGVTLEEAVRDTWERAGADALVLSGAATGRPVDLDHLLRVRKVAPEAPIVVGSGATAEDLPSLAEAADAVIVGSSLKRDGAASSPVDRSRAEEFVSAAERAGWLP